MSTSSTLGITKELKKKIDDGHHFTMRCWCFKNYIFLSWFLIPRLLCSSLQFGTIEDQTNHQTIEPSAKFPCYKYQNLRHGNQANKISDTGSFVFTDENTWGSNGQKD